jgi:hypothetical protein
MGEWIPPDVGPPDEEGFRTFSLYAPVVGETTRVSFNLERLRTWLANTSGQEELYSQEERDLLKLASRIVAARDAFPGHNEAEALATILEISPHFIAESLEKYFPSLAVLAIRAASDVCVKHALNLTVQSTGAPRMYDDKMICEILRVFENIATDFLQIRSGRPLETERHLTETKQALEQLEKQGKIQRGKMLPTQELVSSKLGINARSLREWCKACKLKWHEFLRACGWPVDRKEITEE